MNTESQPPKKTDLQNPNPSPMAPQAGMPQPPWMPGYVPADEIDLVDLGVALWRRRWLVGGVFLVLMLLVLAAALLKKPTYDYTTTLQLGSSISQTSGNVVPLMSAQSVSETMRDTYIPSARYQYAIQNHLGKSVVGVPKITATGDVNGSDVVLSCRARESMGAACMAVEKLVADAFIRDNSRFITAGKNQLASLQSQAKVLQVQLDKLQTSAALYQQQQTALKRQIARMEQAGLQAAKGAISGSAALSNLVLNTEVQRAMDSLSKVRQKLDVETPQQIAQVSQQIDDNRHAQQLQEQTLGQGYGRILNAGLRSLGPVGLGRAAILAIGIVLSIFLALLAALFMGYVEQVRMRLATAKNTRGKS